MLMPGVERDVDSRVGWCRQGWTCCVCRRDEDRGGRVCSVEGGMTERVWTGDPSGPLTRA